MTDAPARSVYAELSQKWHSLAARRKAHFVQLYESGRWRLYYSQEAFIVVMREVVAVAHAWERLARGGRTPDGRAHGDRAHDGRPPAMPEIGNPTGGERRNGAFNLSYLSRRSAD